MTRKYGIWIVLTVAVLMFTAPEILADAVHNTGRLLGDGMDAVGRFARALGES